MGRHTSIKVPKSPAPANDERSSTSIHHRQQQLSRVFDAAVSALDGDEANPALIRELGGLSRAMTGNEAEIRQQEKHGKAMVARMTPEERDDLVMAYLRNLTTERRTQIIGELQAMDTTRSIL